MQIILILCEGPHDVAFITRMLKYSGFVSNENLKINEFPLPMNKLMEQEILKTEVRELNLQQVRQNLLPLNTLQKNDNFIFLYSIGGDGKRDSRNNILKAIRLAIPEPGEITADRLPEGTAFSIVYFFDADNRGLAARLSEVRTELNQVLTTMPEDALSTNGSYVTVEGIKIGVYIFTGSDNNTGKLEDILVPIMQYGNEDIFNNAENYLDSHYDNNRIFPLILNNDANGTIESRSNRNKDTDFDRRKTIIGITGQLQKSGKPNTVYIRDTDYLTLAKINGNVKCQEIIAFFNNFMSSI